MYPFLKERLGVTAGRIVGGILWGVWHFPLVIIGGHFYGKENRFLGCFMICLALTVFGIFIDYIYDKSGSIIVASIAHSAMNAAGLPLMLVSTGNANQLLGPSAFSLIPIIPVIIVSVIIVIFSKRMTAE